ncbi:MULTISPECIES: CAAD domain-containing protein [unclassified Nostoc]|uniref:CAAD domain-containing protein n=1 Tax=unclassified Nostoc TaxID=2593658 RepID=UPI002AD437CA|nr:MULTISPECIES: CAAD domain-containing protein [unclassified Nostoc]MDZ8031936.1 CAAD domain-containing protein [Nostoc sp. DedSLP04]MDZ8096757.1 CAAD domain-containing protein [Nostoc sp. DedQUE05]MDZ8134724.1 CAAD domain-containing protein [Nostoc sp. DedQUE04]
MDTELQQDQYVDTASQNQIKALKGSESGNLAMLPPASENEEQWQKIGRQISIFLAKIPEYIGSFYQEYKLLIISFALLVITVTALRIFLAVLNAINDIPLVSPFLQLIGLGYTIWFTSRYLLKNSTRQELAEEIRLLKKQILGREESETLS